MEHSTPPASVTMEIAQHPVRRDSRECLLTRWFDRIQVGHLSVTFPSGRTQEFAGNNPGPRAHLAIRDLNLVSRLAFGGDVGFAESYMDGEWDTHDLPTLLALGKCNANVFTDILDRHPLVKILCRLRHGLRANTRRGSRRNIAAHYDLGNDFYRLWLDDSMTYSSAIFSNFDEPMHNAQRRKYLRIAQQLELKPGDHILEIGCGWGGFSEIAAQQFGCTVVGLTLSIEQAKYARERVARLGLTEQVDIRLQDYRDVPEQFDKIVSIEMFEAVGERFWQTYLNVVHQHLKPGGKAALQMITIAGEYFEAYRQQPDFIQRYIFPGGMLPSLEAFADAVQRSGLKFNDGFFFGASYAETLRRWDQNFRDRWPSIKKQGFDNRFYRMWHYYLRYCETGFDHGTIDVGQFVVERP